MDIEQPAPQAEDKGKGKAAASNGKRFEIKKWNAVAMWSWAICTDTCAICRNNLYEPSIEYQVCCTAHTLGCVIYCNNSCSLSICCACFQVPAPCSVTRARVWRRP